MILPRIDRDQIRREGVLITVRQDAGRHPNMPNVTAAVKAYQAISSPKPWGSLSRTAEKHHTTPGSILGRINRSKK